MHAHFVTAVVHTFAFSPPIRITLFREPSASFVRRYLERQDAAKGSTNHPFAGFSDPEAKDGAGAAPPQPPPGFQERTVRCDMLATAVGCPSPVPTIPPAHQRIHSKRAGGSCCFFS